MKRIIVYSICVVVAIAALAAYLSHLSRTKAENYKVFKASMKALVGTPEEDVRDVMAEQHMYLRDTIRTQADWKQALDHVSPAPKNRQCSFALRYTDDAKLTRKCVFVFFNENKRVSTVHLASEYW